MTRAASMALVFALGVANAGPSRAQSDDAAYCAKLSDLYRHHIGDMGIGSVSPDVTAATAMEQCRTGNTAAGIAVLEAKLKANGFTLPKRN